MKVKLSKDERKYIMDSASDSYLLLKHYPDGGIDCFCIFDENGDQIYSVNIKGWYGEGTKESHTLEISDMTGTIIGTIRWNNKYTSPDSFFAWLFDENGRIEKQYEQSRRIFKKSWYESTFSDWTLDYSSIYSGDGQKCAEINSISNYKNTLRGTIELRNSYLIDRYYDTECIANDALTLLFWGIRYICYDYDNNHANTNTRKKYVRKSGLETKIENTLDNTKSSLDDRKDTIEQRQKDAVEELHNRANSYVSDKQAQLQEKVESRSLSQKVISVLLKILICLAAPFIGLIIAVTINQYTAIEIDPNSIAVVFFIAAILIVNKNNPGWVMFYEWLKLVLLCILGIIACSFLETIIRHILESVGINGIGFPLMLFVIAGICKWMSRHIDKLVNGRLFFSFIQFISIGLLLGQICAQYVDNSGRLPSIVSAAIIVAVIALSKAKILVRKNVRYCFIGVGVGVLIVCLVEPIIKVMLK